MKNYTSVMTELLLFHHYKDNVSKTAPVDIMGAPDEGPP